ncbi:MAG: hypothetical protein KDB22_08065 [Planctomycetales bacterium]|nr:hypothetical protein [Planctomycetales bacterium]
MNSAVVKKKPGTIPEPSAASRQLVVGYGLLLVVVWWQLFTRLFANDLLIPPASAIILLATLFRWPVALNLLLFQGYLLLTEQRYALRHGFSDLAVIAFLVVLLLMLVCRIRSVLLIYSVRGPLSLVEFFRTRETDNQSVPGQVSNRWTDKLVISAWPIVLPVAAAFASVLFAIVCLRMTPLSSTSMFDLRLPPTALRAIQLAFLLAVPYTIVTLFVSEWSWRRSSPAQAQLYVKSTFTGWLAPDVRFRIRYHRKLRRRSKAT